MMKRLWLLVASVFVLVISSPVMAADVSYDIKSKYALDGDTVNITQEFGLSSNSNLGDQTIRVPGRSDKFTVKNGVESIDTKTK